MSQTQTTQKELDIVENILSHFPHLLMKGNVKNHLEEVARVISLRKQALENLNQQLLQKQKYISRVFNSKNIMEAEIESKNVTRMHIIESYEDFLINTSSFKVICYGKVGENLFTLAFLELSEKLKLLKNSSSIVQKCPALVHFLQDLMKVACCRFYLHCIFFFRSFLHQQTVDFQERQEDMLKEEAPCFRVLKFFEPKLAAIIQKDYCTIIQTVFTPQLVQYYDALLSLLKPQKFSQFSFLMRDDADQNDSSVNSGATINHLLLEQRLSILNDIFDQRNIIIPRKTQIFGPQFAVEALINSSLIVLCENIQWEVKFFSEFFNVQQHYGDFSMSHTNQMLNATFGYLFQIVESSLDLKGLMIALTIAYEVKKVSKIPGDVFAEKLNMLLGSIMTRINLAVEKHMKEYQSMQQMSSTLDQKITIDDIDRMFHLVTDCAIIRQRAPTSSKNQCVFENWEHLTLLSIINALRSKYPEKKISNLQESSNPADSLKSQLLIADKIHRMIMALEVKPKEAIKTIFEFFTINLNIEVAHIVHEIISCQYGIFVDYFHAKKLSKNSDKADPTIFKSALDKMNSDWKERIQTLAGISKSLVLYNKDLLKMITNKIIICLVELFDSIDTEVENLKILNQKLFSPELNLELKTSFNIINF